ncbi:hydantoinase B/oxoprolinase family protein [Lentibacillus sp. N15]|uniref:hydantoinase B/oxoprolinase family protein n=1 Tax=Lentibacillus songyuanensis TaxID=3136161 RepID=UPI0031BB13ED
MVDIKTDKITLEILKNYFVAIAEGMGYTLERTSHTTFIKESADFTTGIATQEGEFFAYPRNVGVTSFLGLNLGKAIRAFDHYDPGDVVITNDPYNTDGMATHLPDIHLFKPIFENGKVLCFAWCFIHCSDVGGLVPASINPQAYDLQQEGFRIPPRKLYQAGELDKGFLELFLANCRIPEQNWGDLKAMFSALNTAELQMEKLLKKFGVDVLRQGMNDMLNWTEQRVRDLVLKIPDGDYSFSDYMDDDMEGSPIRLQVTLCIHGDEIVLDYTGTDPQVNAAFNVPAFGKRHPFLTQGIINYMFSMDPHIPLTGGVVRPIRNVAPKGTIVNPLYPASVGVRYATVIRLYNVVLGALAQVIPNKVPAAGAGQASMVVLSVPEAETGQRQVTVLEPIFGGGGATSLADGVAGVDSSAGYLKNTPIESMEANAPVLTERYELLPDSAGPGYNRGGWGTVFEFRVLKPNSIVTARGMERTRFEPWGLAGGHSAGRTETILNRNTERELKFGRIDTLYLEPGDTVSIFSSGGGGFGDPLKRDPELVLSDVRSGLLSYDVAKEKYGVVFSDGEVDKKCTKETRHYLVKKNVAEKGLIDFGPSRKKYEEVWSPELSMALAKYLLTLSPSMRTYAKRQIHRRIDSWNKSFPVSAETLSEIWNDIQNDSF